MGKSKEEKKKAKEERKRKHREENEIGHGDGGPPRWCFKFRLKDCCRRQSLRIGVFLVAIGGLFVGFVHMFVALMQLYNEVIVRNISTPWACLMQLGMHQIYIMYAVGEPFFVWGMSIMLLFAISLSSKGMIFAWCILQLFLIFLRLVINIPMLIVQCIFLPLIVFFIVVLVDAVVMTYLFVVVWSYWLLLEIQHREVAVEPLWEEEERAFALGRPSTGMEVLTADEDVKKRAGRRTLMKKMKDKKKKEEGGED